MRYFLTVLLFTGCTSEVPTTLPAALDGPCGDLADARGDVYCVHSVPDVETWSQITASGGASVLAATKYSVSVDTTDPYGSFFLNAQVVLLHHELLPLLFPDRYASLTPAEYLPLALHPDTRVFWSGVVAEHLSMDGTRTCSFTVWDDPADPDTTITELDVRQVMTQLQPRFAVCDLAFEPTTPAQLDRASRFGDDIPVFDPGASLDSEAYLEGVAYGRLRRLQITTDPRAEPEREEIAVFDVPPAEMFVPIAGALTATRQAALSHLAVRTAARGVPNCYHRDAWALAEPYEGELVKYTCTSGQIRFDPATLEEVEAYQQSKRPDPVSLLAPLLDTTDMPALGTVDMSSPAARATAVATWGAKGTQLSLAYEQIDPALQFSGLLVPFSYGWDHLTTQGWEVDLGDGPAWHSFQETVAAWLDDPDFVSDPDVRRPRLEALVAAAAAVPADASTTDAILTQILDTFEPDTWLRLRSSSNAEDSLWFNGAGLYTSVRACPADDLDEDDVGPSRCWPHQDDEAPLAEALPAVWASLYNPAAWEERDWYGMPQLDAAMGVLVNDRTVGEQLTLVAFSGSPALAGDDRILIQAQPGNLEIVNPDPGVLPEELLVSRDANADVLRVRPSSIAWNGQWFVSDDVARQIAATLVDLESSWPADAAVPEDVTVLLDTEWKVLSDGRLVLKQVRPFPRREASP